MPDGTGWLESRAKVHTQSGKLVTIPQVLDRLENKVVGVTTLFCGDADRTMVDMCPYHENNVAIAICARNSHGLMLNGGALLLSPLLKSPYFRKRRSILLEDLEFTIKNKGLNMVMGYAHVPCGVAQHFNIDEDAVFDHLSAAEALIWDELGVPMLSLIHSDLRGHGSGKPFKTHSTKSSLEQVVRRLGLAK